MENHHAINGKIHYKWPFSIAMLNYQRVTMNQWPDDSVNQWSNETRHEGFSESINQWINEWSPWFIGSLIHWFIDSYVRWLVDSLGHCFVASLVHWIIDSFVHRFSGSFTQLCTDSFTSFHWHLNHQLVIRWCTSQPQPLMASASQNRSYRLLVSYSHLLFLKLPPRRVPGTDLAEFSVLQIIANYMVIKNS